MRTATAQFPADLVAEELAALCQCNPLETAVSNEVPATAVATRDPAYATEAAEIGEMFPEKDEVLDLLKRAESALCLAVAKYNAAARPSFSQANRAYHTLLLVIESYRKEVPG